MTVGNAGYPGQARDVEQQTAVAQDGALGGVAFVPHGADDQVRLHALLVAVPLSGGFS